MNDPDRTELAERLAFVVGGVNRRLRPPADALTHIALSALATMDRRGALRPGELARLEGVAAPGMTRLVADLEARGLVAREADPDDGRSHRIRLTEAGVAAVAAGRRDRAEGVAALLEEIAREDLLVLEQAVTALESALLRTTPDPARAR